jgi:hypothetical protein
MFVQKTEDYSILQLVNKTKTWTLPLWLTQGYRQALATGKEIMFASSFGSSEGRQPIASSSFLTIPDERTKALPILLLKNRFVSRDNECYEDYEEAISTTSTPNDAGGTDGAKGQDSQACVNNALDCVFVDRCTSGLLDTQ